MFYIEPTFKEEGGLGVRRAKDVNTAMLRRLGWRLFNDVESLRSCTLKNKDGLVVKVSRSL